jgi:hypothetical protein
LRTPVRPEPLRASAPSAGEVDHGDRLVTIGDLALAPIESDDVEELRSALEISRDHAADLVVMVSSMLTPGLDPRPSA